MKEEDKIRKQMINKEDFINYFHGRRIITIDEYEKYKKTKKKHGKKHKKS